jgi:hypothetical protein
MEKLHNAKAQERWWTPSEVEAERVGKALAQLIARYMRRRRDVWKHDVEVAVMIWQHFVDGLDGILVEDEWETLKTFKKPRDVEVFANGILDEEEDLELDKRWRKVFRLLAEELAVDWSWVEGDIFKLYALAEGQLWVWALMRDASERGDDPEKWYKLVRRMSLHRGIFYVEERWEKGKVRRKLGYWVYDIMRRVFRGEDV